MTHHNDKDITLLLGKKLLMGWSMLNEVCKDCKIVPFVENKKDNIILCVSCDRQLKRDENGAIVDPKKENKQIHSSSTSSTTTPSSSTSSTPIPTATTITNITKPPQQQTTTTSNNNDIKQVDMKFYENDDNYYDDYEDEDDTPLTEEEKIAIEKRLKKSDEFSSKMGEFLLKGWSLLSDSCPNNECYGVPLMKDREKKFYCVSCKMSGLEIEDLIQKLPSSTIETPTTTSSPTTKTTTSNTNTLTATNKAATIIQNDQSKEELPKQQLIRPITVENLTPIKNTLKNNDNSTFSPPYPEPEQKKLRMAGTTPQKISNNQSFLSTTSISTNNTSILNEEIQELPDFTDNTLSILFDKLKDAQNQLVATNNIHYCSLIREYTSTISSLLELKKHWTM
ncbi:hypothetical protein RB653_006916 [Dictyostelium firmibasis]|uniref:Sjogrens syndrome scleroderma autoantigen 1 family protein n=1 Tax=Dictyostelium firmibasis TaxID=79012 RepID=A0AAN7YU61_9MYCE